MAEPRPRAGDRSVYRFLHLCLQGRWDPRALQEARSLGSPGMVEWKVLGQLAETEGLAPLLCQAVLCQHLVPAALEEQLHCAHVQSATCTTFLLRALEQALAQLSREGLDVVLLKGAALLSTVYKEAAVRPMRDLDLLVKRDDVPAVLHALAGLGYTPFSIEPHPGSDVAYENEVLLRKPGLLDVLLEIHWSLFDLPHYQ